MTLYEAMKLLTVESRCSHLSCKVQESDVFVGVQADAIPGSVVFACTDETVTSCTLTARLLGFWILGLSFKYELEIQVSTYFSIAVFTV